MNIVVDESVDFGVVLLLRKKGNLIHSIAEQKYGIRDEEVLSIALKYKALLITEDKDFGELTYRLRLKHNGILLIRLGELSRKERIELATRYIEKYYFDLLNNFSVIDKNGIRININKPI